MKKFWCISVFIVSVVLLLALSFSNSTYAATKGEVLSEQKISDLVGGLTEDLGASDWFGNSVSNIGDLDGDGNEDIVVGATGDDDGDSRAGAVYILFMNDDGTVKNEQKISDTQGGLVEDLGVDDYFGMSVSSIGDLDDDGNEDIVVGATGDDDGDSSAGAVYILFLNSNGTVKDEQKISDTQGGLVEDLGLTDRFGRSVSNIGDLDDDGVEDIVVGADGDDDGGSSRGAVYILFLNSDGTVKDEQKISDTQGGLVEVLADWDNFGISVSGIGDLDEDGNHDIVVGAPNDSDEVYYAGAVFVLFLNSDGTVKDEQKICDSVGGKNGDLDAEDHFGISISRIGDLNNDGVEDIVVGADYDDDGGDSAGSVYVLFLNSNGTVNDEQKISDLVGGLVEDLDENEYFGVSVSGIGDLDGDGNDDVMVGAYCDSDGDTAAGAVYTLFLEGPDTTGPTGTISINSGEGYTSTTSVTLILTATDSQRTVEQMMACNNASFTDCSWESYSTSKNWTLSSGDGTKTVYIKYKDDVGNESITYSDTIVLSLGGSDTSGPTGTISVNSGDQYIFSIYATLTLSASDTQTGVYQMMICDNGSFTNCSWESYSTSRTWILTSDAGTKTIYAKYRDNALNESITYNDTITLAYKEIGEILSEQKISDLVGGLAEDLEKWDGFGSSVSGIGDLDGDGVEDIVVGAEGDNDDNAGAVYILFLNSDGTVKGEQKISDLVGGLVEDLGASDYFGYGVSNIGDLDGDGVEDIVVGAYGDDDGGPSAGAVYVLFLNNDGTVKDEQKISDLQGGLVEDLDSSDYFGRSVSNIGDLDGDGVEDIVVGARGDDDGDSAAGAVYILFLNNDGTVKDEQKISDLEGGLVEDLNASDYFGISVSCLGDLDGDGIEDIVVGAYGDNDDFAGAVYILFLNSDGTVKDEQKISDLVGGLVEDLEMYDDFGISVSNIGDIDGDGIEDIIVGAWGDDDGSSRAGAVYILFLNSDGTVKDELKISDTTGWLVEGLGINDYFGTSVSFIGDLNDDGNPDVVVGACGDDDGDDDAGAVYILNIKGPDTTGPTGTISINSGASYTSATSVTLTLSATDTVTGVYPMVICNNASFTGCTWEGYSTSKSWSLTSGDGVKTVYVKYIDNAGNESITYADTITLDTTAPTGTISINSGDSSTQTISVVLTLSATDSLSGVSQMMVCNSSSFTGCSWETYSTLKNWILINGDGTKTVYSKYKDVAGVISQISSDSIIVQIPAVRITSIGQMTNIFDRDDLFYYFTSRTPLIRGIARSNSSVVFITENDTYYAKVDENGDFEIRLSLSYGENVIEYRSTEQTKTRTLTLMIGVDYFPTWLLEDLGLIPTDDVVDSSEEDEEAVIEEVYVVEEEEDQEELNTITKVIKILDEDGIPMVGAKVEIDGKEYITDTNGEIRVTGLLRDREYTIKINHNGKWYTAKVLASQNIQERIEINAIPDVDTNQTLIFMGVVLLILILVALFFFNRRKKNISDDIRFVSPGLLYK